MDNRTVGLRVPIGAAESRRIENRIPGQMPTLIWLSPQHWRRSGWDYRKSGATRPRKVSGEDLETLPRDLDVALDALERPRPYTLYSVRIL